MSDDGFRTSAITINPARLRQLHKALVPFMVLLLLLTLTAGMLFQFATASDRANDFLWLLDLHRGKFGQANLELIYPVLNALGLLMFITKRGAYLRSPVRLLLNN